MSQVTGCGLDEWNPFSGRDRVCLADIQSGLVSYDMFGSREA